MICPFCDIPAAQQQNSNQHFYMIADHKPISKGHSLIISRRHVENYLELNPEESVSLLETVKTAKTLLDEKYHPTGYKLLMNIGAVAGQRVFHFHLHIIPYYS